MARLVKNNRSDSKVLAKRKKKNERIRVCHSTHSFEWCLKGKKAIIITCNKSGTVKNSLRRSSLFRELESKNKFKELVVERNGRPIPPHFPCTLIQPGEQLIVKYVKASGPKQPMAPLRSRIRSLNQVLEFNIITKGGKNITKILRNPALRSYSEVTLYGYKGEKVKHVLERDGRFLDIVFDKTCALEQGKTNVELSNLVDDLGGSTFQIIMLNKNCPPESQTSSLDDTLTTEDSQSSDLDEDENTLQHLSDEMYSSETENHPKPLKHVIHEIPGSRKLRSHLSDQVSDFMKGIFTDGTGQVPKVRDLLGVEYGRSQGSFTAKVMKTLMTSQIDSVCQVRINGSAVGSGFLLFNTFVLTNFHVIEDAFNCNMWQLSEKVTVQFSFESLEQASVGYQVQEVVAYEYYTESGQKYDWALLSLTPDPALPPGLLTHVGFLPQSGSICIIGHPHGGVKMVDLTWIIPVNGRNQIIERHYNENLKHPETGEVIQYFTSAFAKGVAMAVYNTRDLTYETCFSFGSSGSPVFDCHGNVVAMHSGGYPYKLHSGGVQSVIEYAHPLSSILENFIVQLVHRDRLDVLKQLLEFPCRHHEAVIHNVKKLVDSRNYTKFKNTANNLNDLNDDILKKFFEFFCKTDSPDQMDIAWS